MNKDFQKAKIQHLIAKNNNELSRLVKVLRDDGYTPEEIAVTLNAWDDILGFRRMRLIIVGQSFTEKGRRRKDADLISFIDRRIDVMIKELNNCH